ncbi:hypothetical protein M3M33_14525, partial [Loigolactobacillus coryniformis]|uniref:hypothetical protein n=1 Tax=Loigolactobacillus coryniformis TaxID=1610 RepID=UPI00201AF929
VSITTAGGDDAVTIDQTNGAFAPGFTSEVTGTSEIEFNLDAGGGDHDNLIVFGTPSDDTMHLGNSDGIATYNLNGDDDIDIRASNFEEF